MDVFKKISPLILVLILSLVTIRPFFAPGFFPMHDDTQPTRIWLMAKALQEGQFPVRWVDGLGYGYGYPFFNFYAPLPYYIGSVAVIFGLDPIVATKLTFALGILLAGISMYVLASRWWGRLGAILAAIFYIYLPYHAVQVYVRGALGEVWAYAFLPLIFLAVGEASNRRGLKLVLMSAVGFAAVVLSHNIYGLIAFWFLGIWLFIIGLKVATSVIDVSLIKVPIIVIGLGLGLSAFFWLPAVTEAGLTKVDSLLAGTNDFQMHFVYIDQLWDSPWGFAGSAPGRSDGMSFKLGKLHVLGAILGMVSLLVITKSRTGKKLRIAIDALMGTLVTIFMMLPLSQKVWEVLPYANFIQYPWRFLAWAGLFLSFLGGAGISIMTTIRNRVGRYVFAAVFIFAILIVNAKYFQPQYLNLKTVKDYVSVEKMTWQISKVSDEYLPREFPIPQKPNDVAREDYVAADGIIVETREVKSHLVKLTISASQKAEIMFQRAYFPGWRTFIDTTEVIPRITNGIIHISMPTGRHIITAYFGDTVIRRFSNLVSLIAGFTVISILNQLRQLSDRE